jgi:GT2 family glycosyltransferase
MKYDLTASVVAYHNEPQELERALRSFLDTSLRVRIHVIDNSDSDLLRPLCSDNRVEYHFTGKNLGFGAGHNIAIRRSIKEAPYHLVLNPDVYFPPGPLEALKEYMDLHPDVGVVMPKVLYPDGSLQYLCKKLPTPFDLIFRRFIPGFLSPLLEKRLLAYEYRNRDYSKEMDVPCLSGCFMFIRTSVLENIGVFDERYFMYLEDVDLFRRISLSYRIVYNPATYVFHGYAKGSYSNLRLLLHHIQSAAKYFFKWGWLPLH